MMLEVDEFCCVKDMNYIANSEMTHLAQLTSLNLIVL